MAKYNCSTFGEYANLLKKDIKAALRGKIRIPTDMEEFDYGFREEDASKEECEKIILDSFDEIVHHALQALDSGRALSRMLEDNGIKQNGENFAKYRQYVEEEHHRFNTYEFEPDEDRPMDVPKKK